MFYREVHAQTRNWCLAGEQIAEWFVAVKVSKQMVNTEWRIMNAHFNTNKLTFDESW